MTTINEKRYMIKDNNLVLREAKVEDAKQIISVLKKVDKETIFLLREPDEFCLTVEEEEKVIENKLKSKTEILIVAEYNGIIIGTCGVNGSNKKRLRHSANVGIGILKDFWGMGIGKKLMNYCIEWCKVNKIERLVLGVDTLNYRAICLYLSLGFNIEGMHRKEKLLSDGTYRDGYTMSLLL